MLDGQAWRVERQLSGMGVEVEEFGVTTPLNCRVELLSHLVLGESAMEYVDEEPFAERPVLGRTKTPTDGTDQRRSLFH
jgi:hypothetical protein